MENLLSYDKKMLIKDLFEIMNEVLANRDYPTYEHTTRVANIYTIQIWSHYNSAKRNLYERF